MLYYFDYELETANGNKVVHRYIGTKEQVIKAIKIAKECKYRIVKCDYYTP